jgi:multidrug transporter EmrE-like cation transporter
MFGGIELGYLTVMPLAIWGFIGAVATLIICLIVDGNRRKKLLALLPEKEAKELQQAPMPGHPILTVAGAILSGVFGLGLVNWLGFESALGWTVALLVAVTLGFLVFAKALSELLAKQGQEKLEEILVQSRKKTPQTNPPRGAAAKDKGDFD